jgi:peptide/nickel transport system substrate-binding protein
MSVFRRRGWTRLVAVLATLALVAAACGGDDDDADATTAATTAETTAATTAETTTTAATTADTTAETRTLVIASNKQWESREPWRIYDDTQSSPGLRNVIEVLVDRDPVTNDLIPMLATSWEQIDDLTWRFTIRDGVQFHDGTPLTAEDVVHSVNETWAESNAWTTRAFMSSQITAEVAGDLLVDVKTEEKDPIIPNRMYFQGVWSERQFTEDRATWNVAPIGTGPYTIVDDDPLTLNLETNPDWWGEQALAFDTVQIVYRPEDAVRLGAVQTGEAHLGTWVSADSCRAAADIEGIECRSAPSVETMFMKMDLRYGEDAGTVMADKRVRLAMRLAVDFQTIIDTILGGQGVLAHQIAGPSALGHNPNLKPWPYDPERAKELLDEAAADGVPVYETTLENWLLIDWYQNSVEIGEAVNGYLRDVGLDVELIVAERDIFVSVVARKPPEPRGYVFFVGPHGNEFMDYSASLSSQLSCLREPSSVCVPEFTEMSSEAATLTGEARDEALQELARIAYDEVYNPAAIHLNLSYIADECLVWSPPLDHRVRAKEMGWSC